MGGQRSGPHRLVNLKTLAPQDTSRAFVWNKDFGMT